MWYVQMTDTARWGILYEPTLDGNQCVGAVVYYSQAFSSRALCLAECRKMNQNEADYAL